MKSSTFGLGKRWETFWAASLVIFRKLSSVTEFLLKSNALFWLVFLRSWHTLISVVTFTELTLRKINFVVLRHLYMDSQCQANYQWQIQGRPAPPLFLDRTEARKAGKNFFWQVTHIRNHRRRLGTRLVKIQIGSQVSLGWTKRKYLTISVWTNRPFALWHHFTTTTRILQGFGFMCKLRLLLFKPHWDYKV